MKILLIDPPFKRFSGFVNFYFPVGLAYLAAVLKQAGYEVVIFDSDAVEKNLDVDFSDEYRRLELYRQELNNPKHKAWQEIRDVVGKFNPDLIGITALTTKFGSVLKTAEVIKRQNPSCKIIVGGAHPTILPDETLKSQDIDIVVRGEGERVFLNLASAIENNSDLRGVRGISFKSNGQIFHTGYEEPIENLDEVPFPARGLLMNARKYTSEDMGIIISSRGCPFNCSYCCHPWGKVIRQRGVKNVIAEIKEVKARFRTRQFEFKDDTFTINKLWVKEFCNELISEKIRINWSCTTRADVLDEELVKIMKQAGCNIIKLGIETGSERILKEIQKGVTFSQMRKAASLLNEYGIFWSGYFMMGLPTETELDIRKTYEFMKELNPYYASLGVYNPFPGTELFEQAVKMGLVYAEVELTHFFNTNPKDYFFINPEKRMSFMEHEKFDALVTFMMQEFHRHNTKIRNILKRGWARRLAYRHDPYLMLKDTRKAFKWWSSPIG